MDAEEELINLTGPVSLLEAVKSSLEVMNLMSNSSDSQPPDSNPNIFLISGLGGIPPSNQTQDNSRPSSVSRPGIPTGFVSATTSPPFSLGSMGTPRPVFTTVNPKLTTVVSESTCEPEYHVPPISDELNKDGWKNF